MSNYEISKSSLLSLKAEILKKQEEVKGKVNNKIKKVPLIVKNKGVEKRNENDTTEDLEVLEKSRLMLEKKAKLYEKLSQSKSIDDDPASIENRYLVRFKDKEKNTNDDNANESSEQDPLPEAYEDAENSDDEWVEYVDSLGRTRTCLRKDLKYFKSRDRDYQINNCEEKDSKDIDSTENNLSFEMPEEKQLLSDDMRKEVLREQWEMEENLLRNKDNIHYQDILFNEARTHGVGYYGFSKDEDLRRQQQESLEKLRAETRAQQQKSQELKEMREQLLAARVKAAKIRKRARLGLPPEEEENEEEIGPPNPQPRSPEPEIDLENEWKEKLLEKARRNHIRPWDIGKDKMNTFYEYTQEEWVSKKRNERNDEFAPPSTNRRDFRAPPPDFDYHQTDSQLNFSTKKTETKVKFDNFSGGKNLNSYKNYYEDMMDPFNEETRTFSVFQSSKVNNTYKRKYGVMASAQSSEVDESYDINIPTPDFVQGQSTLTSDDYYSDNILRAATIEEEVYGTTSTNTESIEASIEEGLKFLRKQSERSSDICDSANSDMFAL